MPEAQEAHPFQQITDRDNWYTSRVQALNEVVFRSPPALSSYTALTHITFIRETVEDFLYTRVRDGFSKVLAQPTFSINSLDSQRDWPSRSDPDLNLFFTEDISKQKVNMIGAGGRLTLGNHWRALYTPSSVDPAHDARYAVIAATIDRIFADLLTNNPEYLIFGCYSQISTLITNQLFETERLLRAHAKECADLVKCFQTLLQLHSFTIRAIVTNRLGDATRNLRDYHPNLGGMLANFKERAHVQQKTDSQVFEDDYYDLDFVTNDADVPDKNTFMLRWAPSELFLDIYIL
jgi:hypothetical protein